jgi:flagellar motor switch protein FliN
VIQSTAPDRPAFMPHNPETVSAPARNMENVEIFADGFFEGGGLALTTVLNKQIKVEVAGVTAITPADLVALLPLPWVMVDVTYQRGLTGTHRLLLGRESALSLAVASGAAGTEEIDIVAAHEESIREIFNQVLAAAGPTLMPLFTRSVSFAPAVVRIVDDLERLPADLERTAPQLWLVRANAIGADGWNVPLALTITAELAAEIAALGMDTEAVPAFTAAKAEPAPSKMDLILDVTLPVAVELGRARMQIQDILKLAPGSVIELDKSSGDPVELFINDRPIAKGEVVIIDENFGIRLTSIVTTTERIKTLR